MSKHTMDRRDWLKRMAGSGAALGLGGAVGVAGNAQGQEEAPAEKVPTTKFGATGEEIPILVLGCSQRFDPRYDKRLHLAFKRGVTYLDTAQAYARGQSHKTLAPFIQQVGRKNVWVTSKVMLMGSAVSPENYVSQFNETMPELETDYIDMFFMHAVRYMEQLEPEFIKMGEKLKKEGRIRYFGFSCHHGNVPELLEKAAEVGGIDAIQFRYNFRQYGDAKLNRAIDKAKKAGIGLIAMKTQASIPEDQENVVQFKSKDWNIYQAKLKSVWADDRVDAAVSEMTNVEQIMENTDAAMSPKQLAAGEFQQLNRLAALTAPYYCNGCNEICESRVAGNVNVADSLRYLMYADSYGEMEKAKEFYNALSAEERAIEHVDFAEAERACPQGIKIAERLAEAKRMLHA